MLIIDNALVHELLTMSDCIRVQEAAFRNLASGAAIHRPRLDMYFPCEREDGYYRWGTMEGANDEYFAIRMKSDIITWPTASDGSQTEDKYCVRPGTYCGLVMLMSTRNGEPLAFINDGILQHMRVGGGAGIGVKYLSREDSHVVGMIGSGGMARTYLEAFACVRDIKACNVYSPTAANRERFAEEMSRKLNITVTAVDSARAAIAGADIVSSCTDSMKPAYDGAWLEPGMHLTNLGSHEVPDSATERADVYIRQGKAGLELAPNDRAAVGIGHSPSALVGGTAEQMKRLPRNDASKGTFGEGPGAKSGRGDAPDFSDLAAGLCAGRTSRDQITFYRNQGNQGLQFSSVGGWVYAQAVRAKQGREIPTEWFLQDIRD